MKAKLKKALKQTQDAIGIVYFLQVNPAVPGEIREALDEALHNLAHARDVINQAEEIIAKWEALDKAPVPDT